MGPADAATRYAAHGWPVLPLHTPTGTGGCSCANLECSSPGKHPRTRHGLRNATTDPDMVAGWWARWPDANVGIATGLTSGLAVLDVDLPDGPASLARLTARHGALPATCQQLTGSGGRQLLFAHPGGRIRNRAGMLPGLDVRGDGGFIVVPPSRHTTGAAYRWTDRVPPAAMPTWLITLVRARPAARRPAPPANLPTRDGVTHPYATAVLAGEVDRLAAAVEGTRNHTLNRAAFRCGQLVGAGLLDGDHVRTRLTAVADQIGLGPTETERTITSGLAAGTAHPRGIPAREPRDTARPQPRRAAVRAR